VGRPTAGIPVDWLTATASNSLAVITTWYVHVCVMCVCVHAGA